MPYDHAQQLSKAQMKLVEDNIGLALYVAGHKFFGEVIDYDERCALARLGLCKAALHYNPAHMSQAKFASYATHIMQNEIRTAFRQHSKHTGFNHSYSVSSLEEAKNQRLGAKCTALEKVDEALDYIRLKECFKQALQGLDHQTQTALQLRMQGLSQDAIGIRLGLSQSIVSRKLARAKQHLATRLKELGVEISHG